MMEADFLQTSLHFKVPIDKETQSGDLEIPRQVRGRPDHGADCFEMRGVSDERPQAESESSCFWISVPNPADHSRVYPKAEYA